MEEEHVKFLNTWYEWGVVDTKGQIEHWFFFFPSSADSKPLWKATDIFSVEKVCFPSPSRNTQWLRGN